MAQTKYKLKSQLQSQYDMLDNLDNIFQDIEKKDLIDFLSITSIFIQNTLFLSKDQQYLLLSLMRFNKNLADLFLKVLEVNESLLFKLDKQTRRVFTLPIADAEESKLIKEANTFFSVVIRKLFLQINPGRTEIDLNAALIEIIPSVIQQYGKRTLFDQLGSNKALLEQAILIRNRKIAEKNKVLSESEKLPLITLSAVGKLVERFKDNYLIPPSTHDFHAKGNPHFIFSAFYGNESEATKENKINIIAEFGAFRIFEFFVPFELDKLSLYLDASLKNSNKLIFEYLTLELEKQSQTEESKNEVSIHSMIKHFDDLIQIKRLLKLNKNALNQKDDEDNLILHIAVKHNKKEIIKFLVQKNAVLNEENALQDTPLFIAAKRAHYSVFVYLLVKAKENNIIENNKLLVLAKKLIDLHNLDAFCLLLQVHPELANATHSTNNRCLLHYLLDRPASIDNEQNFKPFIEEMLRQGADITSAPKKQQLKALFKTRGWNNYEKILEIKAVDENLYQINPLSLFIEILLRIAAFMAASVVVGVLVFIFVFVPIIIFNHLLIVPVFLPILSVAILAILIVSIAHAASSHKTHYVSIENVVATALNKDTLLNEFSDENIPVINDELDLVVDQYEERVLKQDKSANVAIHNGALVYTKGLSLFPSIKYPKYPEAIMQFINLCNRYTETQLPQSVVDFLVKVKRDLPSEKDVQTNMVALRKVLENSNEFLEIKNALDETLSLLDSTVAEINLN